MARCGQFLFQGVKDFGAHAHRFADVRGTDGHDHEFLNVDRVVGVFAAVDDVHHRHRQNAGRGASDIAIKGLRGEIRRRLGRGQRDTKDRVCPQTPLVVGAVQLDHGGVDGFLLGRVKPHQRFGNLAIHRLDGLKNALAHVTRLVAVALLDRLVSTCRSSRRHRGAAHGSILQRDIDFDGGVSPAVKDFAGVDVEYRAHYMVLSCDSRGL